MRLDRRGRLARDRFTVDGRIPASLLERFDPATDDMTIEFAGYSQVLPAGSLVQKGRRGRSNKWHFNARRRAAGIQLFDLHPDGRFRIHTRNLDTNLRSVDFTAPVEFSIRVGPDVGVASVQLDRRLRCRNNCDGVTDDEERETSRKTSWWRRR